MRRERPRHPHHRHHRGPPRFWQLTRGVHRKVVRVLFAAALLGGIGGASVYAGVTSGHKGLICAGLSVVFALSPLGWFASLRIARPFQQLALVAGEIQAGHLASREQLPEGPGEVGEVGEALRSVADRVAKQLADQRALMAAVSHELRSPLGRARVMIEMTREGSAPPTVFDDLQAEITAMDGLVGDLLAAARIDFEAVSPRELNAVDLANRAMEIGGKALLDVVGEPGAVRADPTLAARALSGLLDNARRHGGGNVALRIRSEGDFIRFTVEDDGPGFAAGDEEQAFTPFWRGPTADGRPVPRGEGLGLALVRQIAEAHGGAAGAERRAEGGARVWLTLPR